MRMGLIVLLNAVPLAIVAGASETALAQQYQWSIPSTSNFLDPLHYTQEARGVKDAAAAARTNPLDPSLKHLPVARVIPNASGTFTAQPRSAQLIRGNDVLEISNDALRTSGLFERAINSSASLARSYQDLEARVLQRQQVEFQVGPQLKAAEDAGDEDGERRFSAALSEARAAQQAAAQKFENDLWDIGLNGAKVARVTSGVPDSAETQRHVLVEAISSSPSNNLGYATTRVSRSGQLGVTTVPSEYLLPMAADANDFFFNQLSSTFTQRTPDGVMIRMTDDFTKNPIVQALASPRFGLSHDTGFLSGNRNFAENISLSSRRAPPAGQTFFFQQMGNSAVPLDLALNTQILDVGGGQSVQFFVAADNDVDQNELDVESLGVRAYNRRLGSLFEGWSLAVGTQQSLFGEMVLKPHGLNANRTLIGTVDRTNRTLPQLAIHAPLANWVTWKVAVEEPYRDDVFFSQRNNITQLTRWPTLAMNFTFQDDSSADYLQLGALLRSYGFQSNATGLEDFTTGWGLSAIARFNRGNSANYIGVAGGNGVGDYIQGISVSAVADTSSIATVSGLGFFAGRQTVWRNTACLPIAELNLAYGYSLMENPAILGGTFNRKLHHGWANYIRFISNRIGVGVEYQYGYRRVAAGDVGENHRFMFLIALRSSPVESSTRLVDAIVQGPVTGAGGLDSDIALEAAEVDAGIQPSGATLSSRPIIDVVRQFQLGGAAHRQGL